MVIRVETHLAQAGARAPLRPVMLRAREAVAIDLTIKH
jgi:hypothetical protein